MVEPPSPIRSGLTILQGGWIVAPEWLEFPKTIRARSPEDRTVACKVRVATEDVRKAAALRRRQPAYELWSVLCGKAPPVPSAPQGTDTELTTLFGAHACFQGLVRPIGAAGDSERFLVYVLKPRFYYRYDCRPPLVMAHRDPVPPDLLFLAYVRLDHPHEASATKGVLTHWQFVEASAEDPSLPQDFRERFVKRLW